MHHTTLATSADGSVGQTPHLQIAPLGGSVQRARSSQPLTQVRVQAGEVGAGAIGDVAVRSDQVMRRCQASNAQAAAERVGVVDNVTIGHTSTMPPSRQSAAAKAQLDSEPGRKAHENQDLVS